MTPTRSIRLPSSVYIPTKQQGNASREAYELSFRDFIENTILNLKTFGASIETLRLSNEIRKSLTNVQMIDGVAYIEISEKAWELLHKSSCYPVENKLDHYQTVEGEIILVFLEAIDKAARSIDAAHMREGSNNE